MSFDPADIIVVGSSTQADAKSSFSNFGPGVDCFAPGSGIHSTYRGGLYSTANGTSFAAPIVCGTLAMLWTLDLDLTPQAIETYLYQGCLDLGAAGDDWYFGHGRINVYSSITAESVYSVRALPMDGVPYTNPTATFMNAASEVVGWARSGGTYGFEALRWSGTTVEDLGDLPGYPRDMANGINLSGQVVGLSFNYSGGGHGLDNGVPFYWDGTMNEMQTPLGLSVCQAGSINDSGEIVGVCRTTDNSQYLGYYWANYLASPVALDTGGFPRSYAGNIQSDGKIYGNCAASAAGPYYACYWPNFASAPVFLDVIPGFSVTTIGTCNASGTCIGTSAGPGSHALVWRDNLPTLLTDLPTAPNQCDGRWINDDGVMIGAAAIYGDPYRLHAVIWRDGVPADLNSLLDSTSAADWVIEDETPCVHINTPGQILGTGRKNGVQTSYIATPHLPDGQSGLTVNCSVVLSDFGGDPQSIPVTFEFFRTLNNAAYGPYVVTPLESPTLYTVMPEDALRGMFSIRATADHFLVRQVNNVVISDLSTTGAEFVLINGDVDNDNEINIVDFGQLAAAFGTSDGDTNWNPGADLDGDGEVTLVDLGILSANFGLSGD